MDTPSDETPGAVWASLAGGLTLLSDHKRKAPPKRGSRRRVENTCLTDSPLLYCPSSRHLFQLRPRLPGVPALLKLRLGLFQSRHAIGASHRAVRIHGPEPTQTVGASAGLIDAARAKAGWAKFESRYDSTMPLYRLNLTLAPLLS
jgi:hypothetical protein